MNTANAFIEAFNPARHAYGIYKTSGTPSAGKKFVGDADTVDAAVSESIVEDHLSGRSRVGFVPIHRGDPKKNCAFGVIDVDDYKIDLKTLAARVAKMKLPLVVCRTKSGGAHLYTFYKALTSAARVRETLAEYAAALGVAKCEIFPKQDSLSDVDRGNWINVPYFGDATYALDADGKRLEIAAFLEIAGNIKKANEAPSSESTTGTGEFDIEGATAALLPFWTSDRHLLALAVAGALLRGGVEEENVRDLIARVVEEARDEEPAERLNCVTVAATALARGARMYGVPELKRRMGDATCAMFMAACGVTSGALGEMNEKYAVINWSGQTLILQQPINPLTGWREVQLQSIGALSAWLKNRPRIGKKELVDWWIGHPNRRQYNGVIFSPGKPTTNGYFNLWGGWPIEPADGDCGGWLDLVREVVCSKDEDLFNWVITFCADAVQRPDARPGITLSMRGKQGTGKGTFVREFGKLFGEHFIHIRHAKHLIGNFNAHLVHALVVFADEAVYPGDKQSVGALKGLITEPTIPIEYKGKDVVQVANHIRVITASNEDWTVPVGLDDRRFCVIDVSNAWRGKTARFNSIIQHMEENGGRAALLKYLLEWDCSKIDLRVIPDTAARREQMKLSMDGLQEYWFNKLCDRDGWQKQLEVSEVMKEFREASPANRYLTETGFGMRSKKLMPAMRRVRVRDSETQRRVYCYVLPKLAEARSAFEAAVGRTWNWVDEETTEESGEAPL